MHIRKTGYSSQYQQENKHFFYIENKKKKNNYTTILSTKQMALHMTRACLRRGNLKKETESLLKTTQNNVLRISFVKAKIDNTLENRKCRLCGDRDRKVNTIVSESCRLSKRKQKN